MKMIKKVLAAVLAMAMVIGMMAMSTFAADRELTVTVKWDAAKDEESMSAWCWGEIENYTAAKEWPGDAMTKNADGTWTIKFTVTDDADAEVGFIPSCSLGQTTDVKIPASGDVTIVVSDKKEVKEDGTEGHYLASVEGDVAGGDSSVMVYVVAAVVAVAAAVTVVCKRRSVEA